MRWQLPISVMVVFALLGCHHADPLVGTWNGKNDSMRVPIDLTAEFHEDKTFVQHNVIQRPGSAGRVLETDKGTWSQLSPNHYRMLCQDIDVTVETPKVDLKKKWEAKFRAQRQQLIASMNKKPDFTVRWVGNDIAMVSEATQTVVYHRVP